MHFDGGFASGGLVFSHIDDTVNSEAEPLRELEVMPLAQVSAFCMKTSSMVLPLSSQGGHSARVNMQLLVNGLVLPVSQMGPDFVLVNTPVHQAPASATVVMQVDQNERRWNVHLPTGISAENKRVQIAAVS